MKIDDAMAAVREFRMGTGAPVAEQPRRLPGDRHAVEMLAGQLSSLKSGITTTDDNILIQ